MSTVKEDAPVVHEVGERCSGIPFARCEEVCLGQSVLTIYTLSILHYRHPDLSKGNSEGVDIPL